MTRFEELLEKARAKKQQLMESGALPTTAQTAPQLPTAQTQVARAVELTTNAPSAIVLNEQQLDAVRLAEAGASFVLMGAAGTGKTTTVKMVLEKLTTSGRLNRLTEPTKVLRAGLPAIAFVAFTNRAVRRIAQQLDYTYQPLCHTIHSLLEFQPVLETVTDEHGNPVYNEETGEERQRKVFRPARTRNMPLYELQYVVIDESSMVEVDLFNLLEDACPNAKFIFIGDLNQIPPVYGHPILGFKGLELPVVELTQVYRQALQSPILALAHAILATKPITPARQEELAALSTDVTTLTWRYWAKRVSPHIAMEGFKKAMAKELDAGAYNPDTDIILCPFNKGGTFGTIDINAHIGQLLADRDGRVIHEVIAGFETHYFAVGDKVLYQSRYEATIVDIISNPKYSGKRPKAPSASLNRWGQYTDADEAELFGSLSDEKLDILNVQIALGMQLDNKDEARVEAASHLIKVEVIGPNDEPTIETVSAASEINKLIFGWAISIHKSQGSEWPKVYLALHHTHAVMLSRELMYTAVTRAKNHLVIFCEKQSRAFANDSTFERAPVSQKIKGKTLAEKLKYFQGKKEQLQTKVMFGANGPTTPTTESEDEAETCDE